MKKNHHVLPQLPLISVTPAMLDDLRAEAEAKDISLSALIRQYLAAGLVADRDTLPERYEGIKHGDPTRLPRRS